MYKFLQKKQTQDNLSLVRILGEPHKNVFSGNIFSFFKLALKLFLSKRYLENSMDKYFFSRKIYFSL